MNEIIKIENGTLNARDLYDFLGLNKSHWSRWYTKNIIGDSFFVEGVDYVGFATMANGNEIKDFSITTDMAKELCMLARNEKGKQARQYFIEVEKRAREISKPQLPQSFSEALQLAADQAKQLELQAPKVEYYDKILDSSSTFTTTQVADDLNMSAMRLNKILVDIGIQYKQSGQFHLYSKIKPLKLAETRTKPYIKNSGQTATSHYLVWTEKGREYILNAVTRLLV